MAIALIRVIRGEKSIHRATAAEATGMEESMILSLMILAIIEKFLLRRQNYLQ